MSIVNTQAALDARLGTVAGLPTVQYENTRFNVSGTPWVRTTLLPAQSSLVSIGSNAQKQMTGLYQVDVIYPEDGGSSPAHTMADLIVAAFAPGTYLTSGGTTVIITVASAMTALPLLTYYYVPVQIQWTVFE